MLLLFVCDRLEKLCTRYRPQDSVIACRPSVIIVLQGTLARTPPNQVEDDTEILIHYNVWGRSPKFWTATKVWAAYGDCRQRATSDSRIFIGLSGSRDWSHGESHGPDGGRHIGKFSLWTTLLRFSRSAQISLFSNFTKLGQLFFDNIFFGLTSYGFCADQNYPWKKCIKHKQSKRAREKLQPLFNIPPLNIGLWRVQIFVTG